MSIFVPTKRHLREALILYFNQKKTAAESHRLLMETYPDHCPTERNCQMWFKKFHEGDFNVEDKQRENRPKNILMKIWKHYSTKIHVKHNQN